MKSIRNITIKLFAVALCVAFAPKGNAQLVAENSYFNVDWQYNFPLSNGFADNSSGWGMNFEGGYRLGDYFGVGGFVSYHTNFEYIPVQTIMISNTSAMTTDQQHALYQLPFGATGRVYMVENDMFKAYAGVKIGASFARMQSDFYVSGLRTDSWGFYASPELGLCAFPSAFRGSGIHFAAYYSYATNSMSLLSYDIDGLSNFGLRLGVAF